MRKQVYCTKRFWDEFTLLRPELIELNDKNIQQMQNWLNFLSFMSKSNLNFDISQDEFNKIKNNDKFLGNLWKKSVQGECGLEFCQSKFPEICNNKILEVNNEILNSIILTNVEEQSCLETSANYGIMVLNPKMALDSIHLFVDNGIAVPNPNENGWDFLDKIAKNAPRITTNNAVIIVDNYIFDNKEKSIDSNLIPILSSLLPFQMEENVTCQITIYTKANYGTVELCNELCDKIKSIRNELKFHINIINVAESKKRDDGSTYLFSKYFHDRAIITNYLWISSGHGFDVFPFNEKRDKPTTINVIYPHFQSSINWAENSYDNLVNTAKKVNNMYHKFRSDYWGDEIIENRILATKEQIEKTKEIKETKPVETVIFKTTVPKLAGLKCYGKIDLSAFEKRKRYA